MALIAKLFRITKGRQKRHETVECGYSVFTDSKGEPVLQLGTYGSKERKLEGKISQSIQIDEKAGRELAKILHATFNI